MLVAFIIFFIVFVIMGVLSFMGKASAIITGGRKDEQGEPVYDDKAVSRFLGIIMCLLALSALLGIVGYLVPSLSVLVICAPIMFIIVMIFALVYISGEDRFKKNKGNHRYKK